EDQILGDGEVAALVQQFDQHLLVRGRALARYARARASYLAVGAPVIGGHHRLLRARARDVGQGRSRLPGGGGRVELRDQACHLAIVAGRNGRPARGRAGGGRRGGGA